MKKVLSTVAALGLVAGMASTAAAVDFSMSGHYTVEGFYHSDGADAANAGGLDVTEAAGESNTSDSWYQHTFEIKPTMKVNDKITMASTIRLADNNVWGSQGDTTGSMSSNNDVYVHHLYMDYASPIGKIRVGRVPAGPYGNSFSDSDTRQNRVMLWPSFLKSGNWSTLFYTAKVTEGDAYNNTSSAVDNDHYEARVYYKNDNLDAGLRYGFTNNNNSGPENEPESYTIYGKYKMDNYFANVELTQKTGDSNATTEIDSMGGMLQIGGKFDAITASFMYFYAEGDDDNSNDNEAYGTTGTEFTPLYILTGRTTGMLNGDQATANASMTDDGVNAFVLAADYAASDRLSLHAAIAYAEADEATATYDDEYGWEYNIGAAYKLLDNLTYEAHFGYLDTGDYFNAGSTTDTTQNVYVLTHHLTMTF